MQSIYMEKHVTHAHARMHAHTQTRMDTHTQFVFSFFVEIIEMALFVYYHQQRASTGTRPWASSCCSWAGAGGR